ncbi:DUF349 domain-containing protein [Antarcticibacterium arcticum]|uniref:DUF349 domain-containing protein n=1 Tax=Antarcticibacterium arcticum TaxID=2585771 RepID=A0A5B8YIH6_9FLAO|nr:DUF349 domain-containing protein [Antarcticibacterium arcticum]QED37431.1 DUF349 domain-containing protein [Antarcticibacterium arcticum]
MSQQENDNEKKDLPKKEIFHSENSSEENKKDQPRVGDANGEKTDGNAFSRSTEVEPTKEKEDQLENAMLEETDSSALRAKSEAKEKEYSNGLKTNEETEMPDELNAEPENETESKPLEKELSENSGKEENSVSEEETKSTASSSPDENEEEDTTPVSKKNAHTEFEDSVAEDSEDETSHERHGIEKKDYHSMSKEELVSELEKLLSKEKIQTIKEHVEEIKNEFNAKFDEELEEKKEDFLAEGGNVIDFHYSTPLKKQFNSLYFDYKEKRNNYYQQLKQDLNKNLSKRLEIIEELKGLLDVEENINTTYKHFKELQDRWRTAGPIPRDKYNTVWNTYHHHVENFYDFLHLNREFRDMDFKHNLEQKLKVIDRAEELTQEKDTSRAFRELQMLHKMWKEELGPVAKEFREDIWTRFSEATKKIHDLRQAYYDQLDQEFEKNLEVKEEIISKIQVLAETQFTSHNQWQQRIKELEAFRDQFFKAGKVPREKNEQTWSAFKQSVRQFNRNKNSYYKGLKKEQYENLEKKRELIRIAEENKDNEDFKATTPIMKQIQLDWKKVGHVPRKDSDKVWKQFKSACNHYFDRLHKSTTEENTEEQQAFDKKKEILDNLKTVEFTGEKKTDLPKIKAAIEEWKQVGKVPYNKRFIEGKFNKLLDQLFSKLDVDNNKVEMMKYENKLHALNEADDDKKLRNEHYFLTKKIEETVAEIRQLENNLQFFANVDDDNPLVQDVHKNIQDHKDQLEVWKEKLQKIKSLY